MTFPDCWLLFDACWEEEDLGRSLTGAGGVTLVVLRTLSEEEVGGRDWVMIDAECMLSDDPMFSEELCFGSAGRKE